LKKYLFLIVIVVFSCSKKEKFLWSDYSLEEALALKSDKIIFLDFYSDNWGACKQLEAVTLSDSKVVDFAKDNLISIKLDAWYDSIGIDLFNKYNGSYIPLLVFLNNKGEEVERVVGYKNPTDFLKILGNVILNKDTFLSLMNKFNSGDRNVKLINSIAIKVEDHNNDELSQEIYSLIQSDKQNYSSEIIIKSELYMAKSALYNNSLSEMNAFITKYSDPKNLSNAYSELVKYYQSNKDTLLEINTYKKMLSLFSDKPSFLNSYAWRMTELNTNLTDALVQVNKALNTLVIQDKSYAQILDTKAEVLWKLGLFQEAIIIIKIAIDIDPDSEYYRDQKKKIEDSILASMKESI